VVPHGVAYEEFKAATAGEVPQMQISKGAIAIMFESSRPFTISEYAWKSDKMHEHDPKMWDNLVGKFSTHTIISSSKHRWQKIDHNSFRQFLTPPRYHCYDERKNKRFRCYKEIKRTSLKATVKVLYVAFITIDPV